MPSPRAVLLSALLLGIPLQGALAQPRPPAVVPVTATQERTIRVEGQGEVKVTPDEAFIDLAVETQAASAQAAAEANAKKMDKVIAALVQAGVARKDLETRNYSVAMEYEPPVRGGEAPKPRGYQVNNSVQVHVRDLSKVGPLLDTALKAGANRVDMVRFGLSKPETGRDGALRDAVARARQSAQVLAAALGVKLGPVLDASTITEPVRPMPLARFAMATAESADVATPIQPQEQTVQATVTLIYAIEK
ncbi:SIMPL domain-containing protein [Cystobacter ferrugineus]|uniref:SIMPL domain-containing protein n=1 Tax=Cystobacter ferrugineus TaxID=83449 RepID=A0A1L9B151_9BACT|nr:SIMPL domain-containing protein [Cystobacter ferrugineus]OJH35997.1 hypothetical protein BON30_35955 [Cystobacter ferrugineus]